MLFTGALGDARAIIQDLLRCNPFDETNATNRMQLVISFFCEADYAAAVQVGREAIAAHPGYPQTYPWLAAALGHLCLIDEARPALRRAIATTPGNFNFHVRQCPNFLKPQQHEIILGGLHYAGLEAH